MSKNYLHHLLTVPKGAFKNDVIVLGGGGQPKVTDGKNYCYFVRKNCQKDDAGEGVKNSPKLDDIICERSLTLLNFKM